MALAEGEMTRCAARRLLYEVPHVLAPNRRIAPFQQEGEWASLEDPSKRSSCAESNPTSSDLSEIRLVVGRGFRNAARDHSSRSDDLPVGISESAIQTFHLESSADTAGSWIGGAGLRDGRM